MEKNTYKKFAMQFPLWFFMGLVWIPSHSNANPNKAYTLQCSLQCAKEAKDLNDWRKTLEKEYRAHYQQCGDACLSPANRPKHMNLQQCRQDCQRALSGLIDLQHKVAALSKRLGLIQQRCNVYQNLGANQRQNLHRKRQCQHAQRTAVEKTFYCQKRLAVHVATCFKHRRVLYANSPHHKRFTQFPKGISPYQCLTSIKTQESSCISLINRFRSSSQAQCKGH